MQRTSNDLSAQSATLNQLYGDLSAASTFLNLGGGSDADYVEFQVTLRALEALSGALPNLTQPLRDLRTASSGLSDATNKVADLRHNYYKGRQETVRFTNRLDWLRLLGFLLALIAAPVTVLCGLCSWKLKNGTGGVYMGMCSFPVAATLFGLAAFQILPGIIITDQCVDFDSMVSFQLSQFEITRNATQPWLNLTTDTNIGSTFTYLSSCAGNRPELFNVLADPGPVLDRNNVNFTRDEESIRNSLNSYNYIIDLKSNVWNTIYNLEKDQNLVVNASLSANSLANCSIFRPVWSDCSTAICDNKGVAGALSLSTCVCFLLAVCIFPAWCVGMVSYKRFNYMNVTGTSHDEYYKKSQAYAQANIAGAAGAAGAAAAGGASDAVPVASQQDADRFSNVMLASSGPTSQLSPSEIEMQTKTTDSALDVALAQPVQQNQPPAPTATAGNVVFQYS